MISAIQYNNIPQTTFTSVMPVKVHLDGIETFDVNIIKPACRQLGNILIGPAKDTKNINIIKYFAHFDRDYNAHYGISGFAKVFNKKKTIPSEHFRYVHDRFGDFFITGPQAKTLNKLGKIIGLRQQECNIRKIPDSQELKIAKENYWDAINNFITNSNIKATEYYSEKDGRRLGNPVTLIINMISNKKYGKSNFKMELENICFEKTNLTFNYKNFKIKYV